MRSSRSALGKWTSSLLWLALAGCSHTTLEATQQRSAASQWARVELSEVDGDMLTFDVYNLSKLNLVILRDKIVLETPSGRRGREPGGLRSYYNVAPGAMHDVKVKFDLGDCPPGQPVKVLFDAALLADGTPVPMAPLPFVCR